MKVVLRNTEFTAIQVPEGAKPGDWLVEEGTEVKVYSEEEFNAKFYVPRHVMRFSRDAASSLCSCRDMAAGGPICRRCGARPYKIVYRTFES